MKTQKLLALFLFILLSVYTMPARAQIVLQDIADRVSGCPYIFEGEVIRADCYWNQDKTFIYTSLTVNITKVFKGTIDCGTVELITEGGTRGDTSLIISHNLVLEKGDMGIFLCQQTGRELPTVDFYLETDSIKLDAKFDEQSFIKYYDDEINKLIVDYQYSFDSLAQVYNLVELYTQINYVDCYGGRSIFDVHKEHEKISDTPKKELSNEAERATSVLATDTTIAYTLQNPTVTDSAGVKFFEFDISLSDYDVIYYMGGLIKLKYDTLILGSRLVYNNKAQVFRRTAILDTSSYWNPELSDFQREYLEVLIDNKNSNVFAVNYYDLPSTPTLTVHVKIQIMNCSVLGAITPIGAAPIIQYFGLDPVHPPAKESYDSIHVANSLQFVGCTQYISSVTPLSVRGGVGDSVTIVGAGFGASRGTGNVFLKNSDNGGLSYVPIDSMDYGLWSDTLITFVVPSIIDSMNTGIKYPPGSGIVKVKDGSGIFIAASSPDSLTIRFAAVNVVDPTIPRKKFLLNLINPLQMGSYLFRPDTNFSHYSDRFNCLSTAIHDWVCATGINYTLGGDTTMITDTLSEPPIDTINRIKFGPLSPGTVAQTFNWGFSRRFNCNRAYEKETDIVVNSNLAYPFFCSTNPYDSVPANRFDLYHVLLHELGHGHSLAHVNDPGAVMWYASSHSGIPAAKRGVVLYDDPSALEGGNYIISKALSFDTVNCTGLHQMLLSTANCVGWNPNAVSELIKPDVQFSVYPNPSNESVNIAYGIEQPSEVEITIYDYLGRIIYAEKKKKEMTNSYVEKVSLHSFTTGFYLVKLSVNKFDYIKKLIKQ